MRSTLVLAAILFASSAFAAPLAVGTKPTSVTIKGDDGGRIDGKEWSSEEIKGKVWALFYVDPDRRNANEELEATLEKENFPGDKYGSIGMINMGATWLPNAAIASSLEAKQEKYPRTIYVKDLNKTLVEKWKMTDDEYDVVVFDKEGKVLYSKDGEFKPADIKAMVDVIRANLAKP